MIYGWKSWESSKMDENRVGWENKFWLICRLGKLRIEEKDNGWWLHGFGKMEHLGKFNLGKTMDKMRWNIGKLNIGWYVGQTKWKF